MDCHDVAWYVFRENINNRRIEKFNVFDHGGFLKDCKDALVNFKNEESFYSDIRRSLMYYFWSKAEYEVLICSMFRDYTKVKVDIFSQIELNLNSFIEYIRAHADDIIQM